MIVPTREIISQIIHRGVASGEFREVSRGQCDVCFHVIFAPLLMLALWRNSFSACGEDVDQAEYLATAIDFARRGLQRRIDENKEQA